MNQPKVASKITSRAELAQLILLAAELRESSWSNKEQRYLRSYEECANAACIAETGWGTIVHCLLLYSWNDAIEWAETFKSEVTNESDGN